MFSRLVTVLIVLPLAIVLIALAVANRGPVTVTIDPFNPGNPALSASMPLFVVIFASVAVGLVAGSVTTWLKQGRYRKQARRRSADIRPVQRDTSPTGAARDRPALAGPRS
ncbi:MAG: LapA family protein [Rhizobiaceae bacterium]|nr:LapA family protein [Rhizobiaceae bacterium]MCV0404997.1 LapA family protein [Rhizobiaceae bacterium]